MARAKWMNWGPFPSAKSPYVYLDSLRDEDPAHLPGVEEMVAAAEAIISQGISTINAPENIQNSLYFLRQVATIEKQSELAFIKARLESLNKISKLPDNSLFSSISDLKKEFDKLQNSDITEIDYPHLIILLNEALLGVEQFHDILDAIKRESKEEMDFLRNAATGETILKNFARKGRKKKDVYNSFDDVIRKLVAKFLTAPMQNGKSIVDLFANTMSRQGAIDFAAVAKTTEAALSHYLIQQRPKLLKELGKTQFASKDAVDVNKLFNLLSTDTPEVDSFLTKFSNTEMARYIRKAAEGDKLLLQNFASTMGIRYSANKAATKGSVTNYNEGQLNSTLRKFLSQIKVMSTSKAVSFQDEVFINFLQNNLAASATGSAGGGTDNVAILGGNLEINVSDIEEKTNNQLNNSFNNLLSHIKSKNTKVSQYVDAYDKFAKEAEETLNGMNDMFILHESTKFYQELWAGKQRNRFAFHGREISIFTFIDSLVTLKSWGVADTDLLKFLAYNIGTDALGAAAISPLTTYFSIFAGLIMFDDLGSYSKKLTEGISSASPTALHLYRLQDIYYPTSYFLTETYKTMSTAAAQLQEGQGFNVTISAPTYNYSPEAYAEPHHWRWANVKATAEQNTKIKIAFARSFQSLIDQLQ